MKARFINPDSRHRVVVRTNTIDVFAAISNELEGIGMRECSWMRYLLHSLFDWRKKKRTSGGEGK